VTSSLCCTFLNALSTIISKSELSPCPRKIKRKANDDSWQKGNVYYRSSLAMANSYAAISAFPVGSTSGPLVCLIPYGPFLSLEINEI